MSQSNYAINTTPGKLTYTGVTPDGTSRFLTYSWTKPALNPAAFYSVTVNLLTRRAKCSCQNHRNRVRNLDSEPTIENVACHCKHLRRALWELGQVEREELPMPKEIAFDYSRDPKQAINAAAAFVAQHGGVRARRYAHR